MSSPLPKVTSGDATTASNQLPAWAVRVPALVTVQLITTLAGSAMVSAGAVTWDAARSGYGASVTVSEVVAVLFVSAVPAVLYSKISFVESMVTTTDNVPTLAEPS